MRWNPILCAVSPVSQNLCGEYLNDFYIFLARTYASFGHSAYCRNHYGRSSHLREKYIKSPQDFVDFHFAATQIITECFILDHVSKHKVFVYCLGMLITSCYLVPRQFGDEKELRYWNLRQSVPGLSFAQGFGNQHDLWLTNLKIDRDHLLILDYLPRL